MIIYKVFIWVFLFREKFMEEKFGSSLGNLVLFEFINLIDEWI